MLVDYAVTYMVCFDDYLDAAPYAKTMRGNGITNFILHVAQCIIFNQMKFVTETFVSKSCLKSLYSRLGFKFIKDSETYPILERLASNLIMSQENPKTFRNIQLAYNVI